MEKRIILGSGFDGTYRRGSVPTDSDVAAIAEFRREGGIFGLVMENSAYAAKGIEVMYRGEYDFAVCSTGMACFTPDGGFLWRDACDTKLLIELHKLCVARGAHHTNADITGYAGNLKSGGTGGEKGCTLMYYNGNFPAGTVGTAEMICAAGFTQFSAYFNSRKLASAAMGEIQREFDGVLSCHYRGNCFDVTAYGVNKASGLLRAAEHFGVPQDNIWAVGDSCVDVPMLSEFNGIAITGSAAAGLGAGLYTADDVAGAIALIR